MIPGWYLLLFLLLLLLLLLMVVVVVVVLVVSVVFSLRSCTSQSPMVVLSLLMHLRCEVPSGLGTVYVLANSVRPEYCRTSHSFPLSGAGIAQSVVCWARCPA